MLKAMSIKSVIILLSLIVFLIGYGINAYLKIIVMSTSLQASNIKLQKEKIGHKNKIKRLENELRTIKRKVKSRNKELAKKKVFRMEKKIAKAPVAMLPWVGAAVIAGTTVYEVNELCKELKKDRLFVHDLFNNNSIDNVQDKNVYPALLEKEAQLCSKDIEKELQLILDEQLSDSKQLMNTTYDDLSQTSKVKMLEYKEKIEKYSIDLYGKGSYKVTEYEGIIKSYLSDYFNDKN